MTLAEVVGRLHDLDPAATIYAARPWAADSPAVVAVEPDNGDLPGEAAGLEYFLEVDLAVEAATVGTAGSRLARVLHYAENDAYRPDS